MCWKGYTAYRLSNICKNHSIRSTLFVSFHVSMMSFIPRLSFGIFSQELTLLSFLHCFKLASELFSISQGPYFPPLYERLPSDVKFYYDGTFCIDNKHCIACAVHRRFYARISSLITVGSTVFYQFSR